jgi:act minimal PKS acyl carrier protein
MSFTLEGLIEKLRECAGEDETADLNADIIDVAFADLGYDSLALLNTVGAIERDQSIKLDDKVVEKATTPRDLLDLINERITAAG